MPVYNMQGQVLFRLQVDKKTLQVKTLRRGTGFQPTDRRFGVRMGQQTRPHAISLQQSNGLRVETLQIPRRLLIGHRNLPRGQIVNPRLKDHKVPHEKIPRHPQKRHLHGWQLGHVLIGHFLIGHVLIGCVSIFVSLLFWYLRMILIHIIKFK